MADAGAGRWGRRFAGTAVLVRLAVRRDRVIVPVWVAALIGLLVVSVASVVALYGTEEARTRYAVVAAASPIARAFDGPMGGTSLGAVTMTETFGILAVLVAIMSVQIVVRHTRREEESGRGELLGSAPVGRYAGLVAALTVALAAGAVVGVGAAVTLAAHGLPVAGSIVAGATLGAVGWAFAAVAAVTAQVSETGRGAGGLGFAAIGAAFLLRAIGDAAGDVADSGVEVVSAWPSWLSPIGWGQQVGAFAANDWWLLSLHAALVVVLVAAAFALAARRDHGSGLLAVRPGAPQGSRWLASPLALAVRLQRAAFLAWALGLGVIAAAFGAIGEEAETLLATSDELAAALDMLGPDERIVDLYFAFMLALLGLAAAGFTIQSVLRARGEEAAGRAEPLLATPVTRGRWLASHLACAAGGTLVILLLAGTSAAVGYGAASGVWADSRDIMSAALVYVPAALALGGLAVAAVGLAPRGAAPVSWAALVASLVMGQLGALLELPQSVLNLSPFTHVPLVPAEPLAARPLLALAAVAAGLTALGLIAISRRDISA